MQQRAHHSLRPSGFGLMRSPTQKCALHTALRKTTGEQTEGQTHGVAAPNAESFWTHHRRRRCRRRRRYHHHYQYPNRLLQARLHARAAPCRPTVGVLPAEHHS